MHTFGTGLPNGMAAFSGATMKVLRMLSLVLTMAHRIRTTISEKTSPPLHFCTGPSRLSIHAGRSSMKMLQTHAAIPPGPRHVAASLSAVPMSLTSAREASTTLVTMLLGHGGLQSAQVSGSGRPLSRAVRDMMEHTDWHSMGSLHTTACSVLPLTCVSGTSVRG